jgi:hypothetical protein
MKIEPIDLALAEIRSPASKVILLTPQGRIGVRPSDQAAAGSGLLSALQLSPRTECAYPPPPNTPI